MVEKQQKKAQSHRYYIACPNASTVPTRKPQKSQNKHKHNACKEPWPQDEKHAHRISSLEAIDRTGKVRTSTFFFTKILAMAGVGSAHVGGRMDLVCEITHELSTADQVSNMLQLL